MAKNPREIRRRIKAVDNTRQITRAMELVARTKMQRTQQQVAAARPYNEALTDTMWRLVRRRGADGVASDLLARRPVDRCLLMCFSADRGLCGGYNANILRATQRQLEELEDLDDVRLITVGRRSRDFFRWRGVDLYDEFTNIGEEADLSLAQNLGRIAMREFSAERVDEVRIVYTEFESVFSHPTKVMRLLPIAEPEVADDEGGSARATYLYEPSAEYILKTLVPRYVNNSLYKVLTEAKASEHAARVTAMKNATDNAGDLIEDLTRQFNRARQAVITREISEIASGAEALAQQR